MFEAVTLSYSSLRFLLTELVLAFLPSLSLSLASLALQLFTATTA